MPTFKALKEYVNSISKDERKTNIAFSIWTKKDVIEEIESCKIYYTEGDLSTYEFTDSDFNEILDDFHESEELSWEVMHTCLWRFCDKHEIKFK